MKKNKKINPTKRLLLFWSVLFLLISPIISNAVTVTISSVITNTDVGQLIDNVKNLMLFIAVPLSTIMMLWAGILFVTSEGDPQKIARAKSIITYVVIGIVVAVIASGLSSIIIEILS